VVQTATPSPNLGFLSVLHDASGYLGGYLVTNLWGRPLEFRLSTAVQPNRVQQILYGDTLEPYLCGELIGKALLEKTTTAVQLVLTDREASLQLRRHVNLPVIWLMPADDPVSQSRVPSDSIVRPAREDHGCVVCHSDFVADRPAIRELLDRLDQTLDLAEPFARIREAMAEARKMGVTSRAA
jgi:hypothetical protein